MDKIVRLTFSLGIFCSLTGAVIKLQHWPGGMEILQIGGLLYSAFIVSALIEYYSIAACESPTKRQIAIALACFYASLLLLSLVSYFTDIYDRFLWLDYYSIFCNLFFFFGGILYMIYFRKKIMYVKKPRSKFDFEKD